MNLAILICEYTGKFILLPNGKLKSIVDMRDFQHLGPILLNRQFFSINALFRAWDRAEIKYKEQREKEHILHMQHVDVHRHPLLFLQEESIHNMKPITPDLFCNHCENSLSSFIIEFIEERYKIYGSFMLFPNRNLLHTTYEERKNFVDKYCINCRDPINNQKSKWLEIYKENIMKEDKKERIKTEIYEKKILEKKRGIIRVNKLPSMKPFKKIRSYHMLR
jgi:hypothetical protein